MKIFNKNITLVLCLLTLMSCGKKEKDSSKSKKILDNSIIEEKIFDFDQILNVAIRNDDLESFRKIIKDNIVDINMINSHGNTYLIDAIIAKANKIRDYLLEREVQIDTSNQEGNTALMVSTSLNQIETVQILINKGALLDKKNHNGDTALHIAIKKEYETIAMMLVSAGANIKITDHDNLTAHDLVVTRNLPELENLLQKLTLVEITPPDAYTIKTIIEKGDLSTMKEILEKYPDIVKTYETINPLCLSIELEKEDIALQMIQLFLEAKVNVNGPSGSTCVPLIEATKKQNLNIINLLLENRAKAHILDDKNLSPLIYAITLNNLKIVELLLSYKAIIEYEFITENGSDEEIEACDVVRRVGKKLRTRQEKKTNQKIKEALGCGFWDWVF